MKLKNIYCFSQNWLWILCEENEIKYFVRFDQIAKLNRIEKEERIQESKIIDELNRMNIRTIKNLIKGFYVAQKLKEKKWKQYLAQNYYLDPNVKVHLVNSNY